MVLFNQIIYSIHKLWIHLDRLWIALDRLKNDFHSEYTKLQITLDDGKVFADA